jgi:hypothetical protein
MGRGHLARNKRPARIAGAYVNNVYGRCAHTADRMPALRIRLKKITLTKFGIPFKLLPTLQNLELFL